MRAGIQVAPGVVFEAVFDGDLPVYGCVLFQQFAVPSSVGKFGNGNDVAIFHLGNFVELSGPCVVFVGGKGLVAAVFDFR